MKTWLTIRLDDVATCEIRASDEAPDHKDIPHTVTATLPVILPAALVDSLRAILEKAKPAIGKRLMIDARRHFAALESRGQKLSGQIEPIGNVETK